MLYDLSILFLCFIFFSFLGWAYEVIFYSVQLKKFVNSGFLSGCLCPIYGLGGVLLMCFAMNIRDTRTLFLAGMIICSVLEYFISWALEEAFGMRWWDYSKWFLNINGRVCAVSMLGFGFATILGVKVIIPRTLERLTMLSQHTVFMLAALCLVLLLADLAHSLKKIEDGNNEKLWFVDEHSKLMERKTGVLDDKVERIKDICRNFRR